jgi:phenylpropionate dioxygenase-like ring-hydroxylating dioxygenase large terminal subunit
MLADRLGSGDSGPRDPRMDDCPLPPIPSGWYAVLRSSELPAGKIRSLHYFGRALVAFRGGDGRAAVLDAFCPHYGAHLGVGGRVVAGSIECPFHGWRFGTDGRCTHAPFATRTPRVAVEGLPLREHSGLIFVYAGGGRPAWEVPPLPEAASERFGTPSSEVFRARIHIQEMRENIVDESHFHFIHGQSEPPVQVLEPDGPHAFVPGRIHRRVLGLDVDNSFDIFMHGPGVMAVRVHGRYFSLTTVALTTPIDERTSELRLLNYVAKPSAAPFLHPLLKQAFRLVALPEVRQEVRIWDHKIHRPRPVLLPHEQGIRALRKWYAQFYDQQPADEPATPGTDTAPVG